ncbi:MAG: alcohol dehydrogenase catalytic domain-containing protein [Candidatus Hydrogenedentes bacterium]|nr:alcohol dehydrogenase catalytic domain-containing protein [Candidatus Hydrogenedentota bacterium]
MKAAFFTGAKQPFTFQDVAVPEPGPGEVRIRCHASGICGTDAHYWDGTLPLQSPWVLGHEPVGTIDALGDGVTHLREGDRVGVSWVQEGCGRCGFCQRRKPDYCDDQYSWMNLGGGHAEYMIARAAGCTLLPDGLDWAVAAPLFCAGYTVMSGYRNAQAKPGDRVGVIGIGGLGHLLVQVAKAYGHEVVAITSSENKREEARQLGADEVLVVKEHAGKALADMGGVDVAISTSNDMKHNSQVIEGIRHEGKLVSMAISKEKMEIDPLFLLDHQIRIIGSQQCGREDLVEILGLAASGKVKPMLECYPLEAVNEVMQRLAEGKVRYRAVLTHECG